MSGHCRKDVQTPNQDMVNCRAFCPAYTTRQKRMRGQCSASVCSAGQTPTQQRARVLCMPCHQYIIYYCNAEYYACKILLLHNSNIIGFSCVCLSGLESQDQSREKNGEYIILLISKKKTENCHWSSLN